MFFIARICYVFLILLPGLPLSAQKYHPVKANKGLVVSAHPLASQAGLDILKKGGNAIDAAVAVGFALQSVFPIAGNIGGGGFAVVRTKDGEVYSLDFRETAPLKSEKNMYIVNDTVHSELSKKGALAAGVPGTVDGLEKLHQRFGKLSWKTVMQPSIDLAKEHRITQSEAIDRSAFTRDLSRFEGTRKIFVKKNEWKTNDVFQQPDLVETLTRISENGSKEFYEGKTADLIVETMKKFGGIISHEDLKIYKSKWRQPLKGTYHDLEIYSMNMPSSGGTILIQSLNMLENFNLDTLGFNSSNTIHLVSSVLQKSYSDRAYFMGDPDFVSVPVDTLISKNYANKRINDFNWKYHSSSSTVKHGNIPKIESEETTHYSVADAEGNIVSITYTLNGAFGSFLVVDGAGFLLNNEMDDFSVQPGFPNSYGLIGGESNSISPQKRMLSSMTPTIILKKGKPFMVVGTPGGSTIPTTVLQVILDVYHFGMSVQAAVNAPRFHYQWIPDLIYYEKNAINSDALNSLKQKGYHLEERKNTSGRCEAILFDGEFMYGGADYRGDDTALGIWE